MTYTTKAGDLWDSIARETLGDETRTADLMSANRGLIEYYTFPAGVVLQIPETAAQTVSASLPPWKRRAHE